MVKTLLTLFPSWYFDLVFAHEGGGGGVKITPLTLFLIGECHTREILHWYLVPYVV